MWFIVDNSKRVSKLWRKHNIEVHQKMWESERKTKLKTARHKGPLTPTKTNYLKAGIKTHHPVTEGTKRERERERVRETCEVNWLLAARRLNLSQKRDPILYVASNHYAIWEKRKHVFTSLSNALHITQVLHKYNHVKTCDPDERERRERRYQRDR